MSTKVRDHRHAHGMYVEDCQGDEAPARRNLAAEERLLRLLRRTASVCQDVFEVHGWECDCDFCENVQGIRYSLGIFEAVLAGWLFTVADGDGCPCCEAVSSPMPVAAPATPASVENPFYIVCDRSR